MNEYEKEIASLKKKFNNAIGILFLVFMAIVFLLEYLDV